MTAAQAWPYAVARGRASGSQAIVVPTFIANAGLTYLLEYASGGEAGEPDAVTIREVIGATGPLSLVYRIVAARGDRYGLGDSSPLKDRVGRTIPVFEGLVLQLPARRVASLDITVHDLDEVTRVSIPAFRQLWNAPDGIDAAPSSPMSVGEPGPGTTPLNMQIAEPYVLPDSEAYVLPDSEPERRGESGLEHVGVRVSDAPHGGGDALTAHRTTMPPRVESRPAKPPPTKPGSRRVRRIAGLAVAGALIALIVLILTHSPSSSAQNAVNSLCANLQKDNSADAAYQQFSNGYRKSTSLAAFRSQLLGSNRGVSKCIPGAPAVETRTTDQAIVTLHLPDSTIRTADLTLQQTAGQWLNQSGAVR